MSKIKVTITAEVQDEYCGDQCPLLTGGGCNPLICRANGRLLCARADGMTYRAMRSDECKREFEVTEE